MPRRDTPEQRAHLIERIRTLSGQGIPVKAIATRLGATYAAIYQITQREGITPAPGYSLDLTGVLPTQIAGTPTERKRLR